MEKCSNCKHYAAMMYCTRHAPIENEKTHDSWPRVSATCYCGDWERIDRTKVWESILFEASDNIEAIIEFIDESKCIDTHFNIPDEIWIPFCETYNRLQNILKELNSEKSY